jgi:hypothetical protein
VIVVIPDLKVILDRPEPQVRRPTREPPDLRVTLDRPELQEVPLTREPLDLKEKLDQRGFKEALVRVAIKVKLDQQEQRVHQERLPIPDLPVLPESKVIPEPMETRDQLDRKVFRGAPPTQGPLDRPDLWGPDQRVLQGVPPTRGPLDQLDLR